jgi:hypothetical protein
MLLRKPRFLVRLRRSALIACVSLLVAASAGAKSWTVVGAMNGQGANGVSFASEIVLVNPDGVERFVSVVPINPPGGPISDPLGVELAPGETRPMPSPLAGGGAVAVHTDGGVVVFGRIDSTVSPSRTRSAALPVFDDESFLQAGETGHAVWASQSQDATRGIRTNVGLVLSAGGAATVALLDEKGTVLGSVDFQGDDLQASFVQSSLSAFTDRDVPIGRVAIHVTRGSAVGYVGVVDNVTGSLAMVPAQRLPPPPNPTGALGRIDLVSSGVAQIPGREGTLWHTDARLGNPGSDRVEVDAYLLGSAGHAEPASLFLEPGQTLEIPDLVQSLFDVSAPTTGAVLWRASGSILVATRTRNGNADEILGFGISNAMPVDEFVTSVDPAAQLAELRQDSQFRANLLAVAGPSGALLDFDLLDEAGNLVATSRESLPSLGWSQFALPLLFPAAAVPTRSRIRVRVESGSVDVRASVLDNSVNDPVFIGGSPSGSRVTPPSPLFPTGTWGDAPNGMDHLMVDGASITIFRQCQTGSFPQPLWLDADGGFGVIGIDAVTAGPTLVLDAVLVGHIRGDTVTIQIIPISEDFGVDSKPETFVLGGSFGPFTGLCPIEYRAPQ